MDYGAIEIGMRVQIVNSLHLRNGYVGTVVSKTIAGTSMGLHSGEWVSVEFTDSADGIQTIDTFRPRYLKSESVGL